MKTIHRPAALAAFGLVAALAIGACGGDGGSDSGSEKAAGAATGSSPAATESAGGAVGGSASTLEVEAHEFSLSPKDLTVPAGNVTIKYRNAGAIQHTLLIEGVSGLKLDVMSAGDVDTGSVELAPGTYTLYCDVAGHRAAGMLGQLTVS